MEAQAGGHQQALMLAQDVKITDETILSQIRR
jgi:hypothetical protein